MIVLTSDIDWAPENVINYTLSIFKDFDVKCTLFATHESETLKSCNPEMFEIGIHPNFDPLLKGVSGSAEKIVDDLLSFYPKVKGVRAHNLTNSSLLFNIYKSKGLLYESSLFLPYFNNISLFELWNGMIRVPFNWEDDVHMILNKSFDNCGIDIYSKEEIFIFNFHPIHIYLNTEVLARYTVIKNNLKDITFLDKNKNYSKVSGTKDLLLKLLEFINLHQDRTYTLTEIVSNWEINNQKIPI